MWPGGQGFFQPVSQGKCDNVNAMPSFEQHCAESVLVFGNPYENMPSAVGPSFTEWAFSIDLFGPLAKSVQA